MYSNSPHSLHSLHCVYDLKAHSRQNNSLTVPKTQAITLPADHQHGRSQRKSGVPLPGLWQAINSRCCLRSLFSCLWTHLADTLRNIRCSWVIVSTDPTLRFNLSAISRTVRLSVSTRLMFSIVVQHIDHIRDAPTRTSPLTD